MIGTATGWAGMQPAVLSNVEVLRCALVPALEQRAVVANVWPYVHVLNFPVGQHLSLGRHSALATKTVVHVSSTQQGGADARAAWSIEAQFLSAGWLRKN
jgi:hypothetical protein